jgi:hypothetical protein
LQITPVVKFCRFPFSIIVLHPGALKGAVVALSVFLFVALVIIIILVWKLCRQKSESLQSIRTDTLFHSLNQLAESSHPDYRKTIKTTKPDQVFSPTLVEPKYENVDPSRSTPSEPTYLNDKRDMSGDYNSLKLKDATDTGKYTQLEGVYQEITEK